MDQLDHKILNLLQGDASLPVATIAERVRDGVPAC